MGRRVEIPDGHHVLQPGEYGKWSFDGVWYARPPVDAELTANLARHQVTEHADGTITVKPSILVQAGAIGSWHGWLERGMWRQA